ncbi:MAG: bifunctional DNA primase/polymerase [Ilumatobacteraceae bacterium]
MTPLEHALWYASIGWRVVPIPPGYKYPRGIDSWETKATVDPDKIRRYWTKNPDHGIGIATGPESGIFILDIDPDDGGDDSFAALEAKYGPLPDTVEAITGGNGRHLVFRWPEVGEIRNSASGVLGVGIDVRGVNGQFVVAPTVHPESGQQYCWEVEHDPMNGQAVAVPPTWLIELLQAPVATDKPRHDKINRDAFSDLPGDRWATSTTWAAELQADGATFHSSHTDGHGDYYELWTRPGKDPDNGASASLYYKGSDVLKVFSSKWHPLDAEQTYTLWGYHVTTKHGGDYAEAARVHGREQRADPFSDPPAGDTKQRRSIVHNGRQLDEVIGEAIAALNEANDPPQMFVRAGQLCRLRDDENGRPLIEGLRAEHVRLRLAESANWFRVNKDGVHTSTTPPNDVATAITVSGAWAGMPALAGVVELPVLRPNGTFHTDHGYDPATRLYHWHVGTAYPPISDAPTPADLAAAVALVDEALCDFPWDTAADRANAWALLLTPLVRAIVGQVPMALVDAPEPGTGKGLLVKVSAIITIGRAAALMAWPSGDEELEKKVTAALMAGHTMLIFDNVEGMIRSPALAAVLTADTWQGRVLGRSEMVTVPNRATWAATGNNIDVGGDLARRCYRIRLDARQAQPWLRTGFKHTDLEQWVTTNRSALLHALCTIIQSWWTSGRPMATDLPAMGGYSQWVRTIGGILNHAGIGHFLGNLADFHASADREASSWEAFLNAWHDQIGDRPVSVGDLVAVMRDVYTGDQLVGSLPDELSGEWGKSTFTQRFGYALRKRTGRHYGSAGLHIVEMPRDRRRVAIYSVTTRTKGVTDAGLPQSPAQHNSSTRDDANERGTCGTFPPTPREKSEELVSEKNIQRGEKSPQVPHSRASDDGAPSTLVNDLDAPW